MAGRSITDPLMLKRIKPALAKFWHRMIVLLCVIGVGTALKLGYGVYNIAVSETDGGSSWLWWIVLVFVAVCTVTMIWELVRRVRIIRKARHL
jgi:hypothetical protein